ncbi:MAG: 8-oxo-dGTP diphosphatase [Parasphingorhabdus sp.]|jgi:8-oxo-dGTP diphosphatase
MNLSVVVGVMIRGNGQVLVAERPAGKACAGQWEFPGGKVEQGESFRNALNREIKEELGVQVEQAEPLFTHVNNFLDRTVELHIWKISKWGGIPEGLEGQSIRWLRLTEIEQVNFLPGNILMLPKLERFLR